MSRTRKAINLLQEFSIPLISGVILSVVWANSDPAVFYSAMETHLLGSFFPLGPDHPINFHFLMNDAFMVVFFGIAAKEITESLFPGGALSPIKKALNPIFGTVGGVLGPVLVFKLIVLFSHHEEIARGWAIPTATDIALAWLTARLVFGNGHPAISFLLLLAIVDDGIGLAIIAIFYGDPEHPVKPALLLLVVLGMLMAYVMRRLNMRNHWLYFLGPGTLSWWGLMLAHLHPALAAVFIVPFMPSHHHDTGLYEDSAGRKDKTDTLNAFKNFWRLPVDFGLFGFGLANAGVAFSNVGIATWGVLFGLLIGKPLGIFSFSYLAHRLGFSLPKGMDFKDLVLAGLIGGAGLTVALFVAGVAYSDPLLTGEAKMGALLSALVIPLALLMGRLLRAKRR